MFRIFLVFMSISSVVQAQSYLGFNSDGKLVPLQKGNAPAAFGAPSGPNSSPARPTQTPPPAVTPPVPPAVPPRTDTGDNAAPCMASGCTTGHAASAIRR